MQAIQGSLEKMHQHFAGTEPVGPRCVLIKAAGWATHGTVVRLLQAISIGVVVLDLALGENSFSSFSVSSGGPFSSSTSVPAHDQIRVEIHPLTHVQVQKLACDHELGLCSTFGA